MPPKIKKKDNQVNLSDGIETIRRSIESELKIQFNDIVVPSTDVKQFVNDMPWFINFLIFITNKHHITIWSF